MSQTNMINEWQLSVKQDFVYFVSLRRIKTAKSNSYKNHLTKKPSNSQEKEGNDPVTSNPASVWVGPILVNVHQSPAVNYRVQSADLSPSRYTYICVLI